MTVASLLSADDAALARAADERTPICGPSGRVLAHLVSVEDLKVLEALEDTQLNKLADQAKAEDEFLSQDEALQALGWLQTRLRSRVRPGREGAAS